MSIANTSDAILNNSLPHVNLTVTNAIFAISRWDVSLTDDEWHENGMSEESIIRSKN